MRLRADQKEIGTALQLVVSKAVLTPEESTDVRFFVLIQLK